jgi:DNA-binding HxlR family transcriptional regulator
LAQTLKRLEAAELIERKYENGIIVWYASDFGKQYLEAAFNEFDI